MLYSFFTFKPNAVFVGKAYVIINLLVSILSILFNNETNGEAYNTVKQFTGGAIWFLFLCISKQINNTFPVESRQILKRDWIWISVYLAYPILFMVLAIILKD